MNHAKKKSINKILKVFSLAAIMAVLPMGMSAMHQTFDYFPTLGIEAHAVSPASEWVQLEMDNYGSDCVAMRNTMYNAIDQLPESMKEALKYYGLRLEIRDSSAVQLDNLTGAGITHYKGSGRILIGMAAKAPSHDTYNGRLHSCLHELGHAVHFIENYNGKGNMTSEIRKQYQNACNNGDAYLNGGYYKRFSSVNKYGYTNEWEYFAEVFAGYMMEGNTASSSRLYSVITQAVNNYKSYFTADKLKNAVNLYYDTYKTNIGSSETIYLNTNETLSINTYNAGLIDIYVTDSDGHKKMLAQNNSDYGMSLPHSFKDAGKYTLTIVQKLWGNVISTESSKIVVVPKITNEGNLSSVSKKYANIGESVTVKCHIDAAQDQLNLRRMIKITTPDGKTKEVDNCISSFLISAAYSDYTFKPTQIGLHKIQVTYLSDAGKSSTKTLYVTAQKPLENISKISGDVITDKTSNQQYIYAAKGQRVYVQAAAKNILKTKDAKQYLTVSIKAPNETYFVKQKDYLNSSNTFSFKPDKVGKYVINVTATDARGKKVTKQFSVYVSELKNKSTVSKTDVSVNEIIKISCAAENGKGPYKYTLGVKEKSAEKFSNFLTNASVTTTDYAFKKAGQYQILVSARDAYGRKINRTINVTVFDQLRNMSTVSTTSTFVNGSIYLKGQALGGKSSYQYAFYCKGPDDTGIVNLAGSAAKSPYSSVSQRTFVPHKAGQYQFRIVVKDQLGRIIRKNFTVDVKQRTLINTSQINSKNIMRGNKVTVTASSLGGSGVHKYAFYYKKSTDQKWTTFGTAYGNNTKAAIPFNTAGTYDIKINVKDQTGKVVGKTFTVTVKTS